MILYGCYYEIYLKAGCFSIYFYVIRLLVTGQLEMLYQEARIGLEG